MTDMWLRITLTVVALIFMGAVIVGIGRACWKDSKDDFKMVLDDCRKLFKKKRAD